MWCAANLWPSQQNIYLSYFPEHRRRQRRCRLINLLSLCRLSEHFHQHYSLNYFPSPVFSHNPIKYCWFFQSTALEADRISKLTYRPTNLWVVGAKRYTWGKPIQCQEEYANSTHTELEVRLNPGYSNSKPNCVALVTCRFSTRIWWKKASLLHWELWNYLVWILCIH